MAVSVSVYFDIEIDCTTIRIQSMPTSLPPDKRNSKQNKKK